MSPAQKIQFSQDMLQMNAVALVSVRNHYHINELHLFWDTTYIYIYIYITYHKCLKKHTFLLIDSEWLILIVFIYIYYISGLKVRKSYF